MNDSFDYKFEEAIRFLSIKMPSAKELVKPTLLHSLRVGMYLYEKGYSKNIVIAGLLHDLTEDAGVTLEEIKETFGDNIAKLVQVESKDTKLDDEIEKADDLVERCIEFGDDAVIIKAADVLDNLKYFRKQENVRALSKLSRMGEALLKGKSSKLSDELFKELRFTLDTIN